VSLNKIQAPITKEMREFDPHFKKAMHTNIPLLSNIIDYMYRRKGKQLRPMLVFLSAKLTGSVSTASYTGASLIELLHTATLVHDDVVDESYQRRGFFSINALWKSKVAVLVGDFLFAKGLLVAIENGETDLLKIVSDAVREISEGELLQIQKSRKLNITEEDYFEIIRKKTATLIAACTAVGAKSTKSDQETIDKMYNFGESLGIAFQIRDDIFDYEKSSVIGKPTGNDIKEKKLTLPLIYALRKTDSANRKHIIKTISKHHKNRKKIEEIMQFVSENGGLEYANTKMNEYKTKAIKILNSFPECEVRKALHELVEFTVNRKK